MHLTGLIVQCLFTPIPLARHNNTYLMDRFVAQQPSPEQLCILNEVRLFKQVTHPSDTVTVDGIYIDTQIFSATAPTQPTPFDWPKGTQPNATSMLVWKHFLRVCFTTPYTVSKHLLHPLGPWFDQATDSWEWWFSLSTNSLYKLKKPGWSTWHHHTSPY